MKRGRIEKRKSGDFFFFFCIWVKDGEREETLKNMRTAPTGSATCCGHSDSEEMGQLPLNRVFPSSPCSSLPDQLSPGVGSLEPWAKYCPDLCWLEQQVPPLLCPVTPRYTRDSHSPRCSSQRVRPHRRRKLSLWARTPGLLA